MAHFKANISPVLLFLMRLLEEENADKNTDYKDHGADNIRKEKRIPIEQRSSSEPLWVILAWFSKSSANQGSQDRSLCG